MPRNGRFADDGNINDLPWASVFDPAANARALSAIQAEGFRAASQLVDRFVRLANNGVDAVQPASAGPRTNGGAPQPESADLERLMRSWWSMAGQFLRGSAATTGLSDPVALDVANDEGTGTLLLDAVPPGTAAAEVWLHNRGPRDLGVLRLRCSDLMAHDGSVVGSAEVRFDPEAVPMPARCSRGVTINIEVGQHAPGRYRGSLLVEGHPDLWLPAVLDVRGPAAS